MAKRPWVTPEEVKAYTDFAEVLNRKEEKLRIDISRAETYVISYTNNKSLADEKEYPEVPEGVRTAVIILAEAYAHNAVEKTKTLKSETFDDYSYTAEQNVIELSSIMDDIAPLLEEFKQAAASNSVNMRMRKL